MRGPLYLAPPPPPHNLCRQELRRASSNLPWVDVMPSVNLNVYRILQRDYLLLSREAVERLVERLRRPVKPWDKPKQD